MKVAINRAAFQVQAGQVESAQDDKRVGKALSESAKADAAKAIEQRFQEQVKKADEELDGAKSLSWGAKIGAAIGGAVGVIGGIGAAGMLLAIGGPAAIPAAIGVIALTTAVVGGLTTLAGRGIGGLVKDGHTEDANAAQARAEDQNLYRDQAMSNLTNLGQTTVERGRDGEKKAQTAITRLLDTEAKI